MKISMTMSEVCLEAESLADAIDLVNLYQSNLSHQAGFRIEKKISERPSSFASFPLPSPSRFDTRWNTGTSRTTELPFFRLYVPVRDWACHSDPKGKKAWCDHNGPGGFMGHTCVRRG